MTQSVVEKRRLERMSLGPKGRSAFYDLGFGDEEAAELARKAELMTHLEQYMARNKLTQARAAKVFGVTQPRVSDLMNGKLSMFSLDELIRMYDSTGSRVRLVFDEDVAKEGSILKRLVATGVGAFTAAFGRRRRVNAKAEMSVRSTPRKRKRT